MRHLRAVLGALPRDSGVGRIHDPEGYGWNETVEMLAVLAEVIDGSSWRTVMPHAKKGWKPPKPLHVRRPWEPKPDDEAPRTTMAAFKKMMTVPGAVTVLSGDEEVSE